eukprot:COSAG02_NODE_7013_length_3227_cov_16.960038_1_plen_358_part_00
MVVRRAEAGLVLEEHYGVRTFRTVDELVAACPREQLEFVLVCVSGDANAPMLLKLAELDIPSLSQTALAPGQTVEELTELYERLKDARVQVAEQYLFQPIHQARLSLLASGRLGDVSHAQVSAAHGYHGTSLLRHYLGVGAEPCRIKATQFTAPVAESPGRQGFVPGDKLVNSTQTIAWLAFDTDDGEKLGVWDWVGDIYFSYIRTPRIVVRGTHGEIVDKQVRYLLGPTDPMEYQLERVDAGIGGQPDTLEGLYFKSFVGGGEYLTKNAFAEDDLQPRLTDDELANAVTLVKMSQYAAGGPSFYSLADASQDRYLDLCIAKAAASGEEVLATCQVWSDAVDGPAAMAAKAGFLAKL